MTDKFSCLFAKPDDVVPCHVPFWQRGRHHFFAKSSLIKIFQVTALSLSLAFAVPAKADALDSLIRILVPSYKKEKTAPTATPTQATPEEGVVPTDDADLDGSEQYIDDGTDFPLGGQGEALVDLGLPPDLLHDDVLDAPDSIPMLAEPDLYALLSAEFDADRGEPQKALRVYKAESFKRTPPMSLSGRCRCPLNTMNPVNRLLLPVRGVIKTPIISLRGFMWHILP